MADSFDVIVIGGGPGGYHAAIRAAQLGKNTAVVEMDKPGGRCLNYACIPAKTMLHTAELFDHAQNSADLGVKVSKASLDWDALASRRAKVSETLSGGVKMLWDKNKVTMIEGKGALDGDANVVVDGTTYEAGSVVLATGSVALTIPGVDWGDRVVDTWGAWSLPSLPKSIAVVGAGASGAEIASGYVRYGTEVTLVEMLPQILPAEDKDVVRVVERVFKKQGMNMLTGTPISEVEAGAKSVKAKVGDESIEVEYLCIAGGRAPDTESLGLDAAGVKVGDGGRVEIDEY
jgi:dihydrolipoamide dehydrogenase